MEYSENSATEKKSTKNVHRAPICTKKTTTTDSTNRIEESQTDRWSEKFSREINQTHTHTNQSPTAWNFIKTDIDLYVQIHSKTPVHADVSDFPELVLASQKNCRHKKRDTNSVEFHLRTPSKSSRENLKRTLCVCIVSKQSCLFFRWNSASRLNAESRDIIPASLDQTVKAHFDLATLNSSSVHQI